VVLQWCYSVATFVSQWCYDDVTMMLQWCYSGVTIGGVHALSSSDGCSVCENNGSSRMTLL
jgi:hypothetical protein